MQISEYEKEVEDMNHMTRQEYVASLRRYIINRCIYCLWHLLYILLEPHHPPAYILLILRYSCLIYNTHLNMQEK